MRALRYPLAVLLLLAASACAHSIGPGLADNHPRGFDFSSPNCPPAPRPAAAAAESVDLRYLGTGGLYVEWRGEAVLFAPFFTRPGLLRVGLAKMSPGRGGTVQTGLGDLTLDRVGAIVVGHAHYDHLEDVPEIALDHAPGARVYSSRTARHLLFPYPAVYRRSFALDRRVGEWVGLRDAAGDELPMRLMPLDSTHAPQTRWLRWAEGEVLAPLHRPWTELRHWRLRGGRPLSFLLDLLDENGGVRFRLFYQDSASHEPTGLPAREVLCERRVDVAALCMPSHHLAKGFPEYLLAELAPRHVLATHYEDFFRRYDRPTRFVSVLSRRKAESFLRALSAKPLPSPRPPENRVCGPSTEAWTMALPGEWLRFATAGATDGGGEDER